MGDRIAILRAGGRLAQYDTPAEILTRPADEFVAQFVGADRALKRLGLSTLADVHLLEANGNRPSDRRLPLTTTVRDALSAMLTAGGQPLTVVDGDGQVVGLATLELLGGLLADGQLADPEPGSHPELDSHPDPEPAA
jgi:osmoprotectant transport system ATP-binding protein